MITQQSITTVEQRGRIKTLSEHEVFFHNSGKLKDVECPKCGEVNCLFQGVVSFGCRKCMNYFGEEDFK